MKTTPVHQRLETPTETTRRNMFIMFTSEGRQWAESPSDWNLVSNQQSFIDQAIDQ